MNKTIKILIALLMLTGCVQTEKSVLDDVTDSEYAYTICKSSCDNQSNNLSDAINKAKIAGVSEEQIEAAKALGRDKANREIEAEIARLDEKCKSENKIACNNGNGCCDNPSIAAAADAAAADAAAADAATAAVDAAIAAGADAAAVASDSNSVNISDLMPENNENTNNVSIVDVARMVSAEFAKLAPMQMDAGTILEGSYSIGSTVVLLASINPDELGFTNEDMISVVSETAIEQKKLARNGLCSDKKILPYLSKGITIRYKYRLLNGQNLFENDIDILSCKN